MTRRLITGILEGGKVTTTTGTVKESGGSTTPEFANIQEQSIGLQRSRSHTLQDYEDASWFSYDGRGQAGYEVQELGGRFDSDAFYDRQNRPGGGHPNRKKHVASEPSPHVIFLGLDLDFTEADVSLTIVLDELPVL